MSLKGLLVPLPTSKIVLRPSGKYKYVYYTLRAYRNDKGQPASETVCIGRLDSNPKLMIPNDKYYEYFNEEPIEQERSVKSVLNYGTYYALNEIANNIGLIDILKNVFSDDYYKILLTSYYVLCEKNILSYIDDWCETTHNKKMLLTSQILKSLNILYENMLKAGQKWFVFVYYNFYDEFRLKSFLILLLMKKYTIQLLKRNYITEMCTIIFFEKI